MHTFCSNGFSLHMVSRREKKKDIFRFEVGQFRLMSEWEINLQIPAELAWVLINSVHESRKEPKSGMCTCLKRIYLTILIKTFRKIIN